MPRTAAASRVSAQRAIGLGRRQPLGRGEERGQPVDQPGHRERRERHAEDRVSVGGIDHEIDVILAAGTDVLVEPEPGDIDALAPAPHGLGHRAGPAGPAPAPAPRPRGTPSASRPIRANAAPRTMPSAAPSGIARKKPASTRPRIRRGNRSIRIVSAMTMKAAPPTPTSTRAAWSWSYDRARPVPTVGQAPQGEPDGQQPRPPQPIGQIADRRRRDGEAQQEHRGQPSRLGLRQSELLPDPPQDHRQQPSLGRVEQVHREQQREDGPGPARHGVRRPAGLSVDSMTSGPGPGLVPGSAAGLGSRIGAGLIHADDLRDASRRSAVRGRSYVEARRPSNGF